MNQGVLFTIIFAILGFWLIYGEAIKERIKVYKSKQQAKQ